MTISLAGGVSLTRLTWGLVILFCADLVFSQLIWSQDCTEHKGISVLFRQDLSVNRDLIHKRLRTRLVYRAKKTAIDIVEKIDSASLENLCAEYRKENTVLGCEINCKLKLNDRKSAPVDQCETERSTRVEPESERGIQNFLKQFKCSPFPDQASLGKFDPSQMYGDRLSPLWAQEAIGLPEAQRTIEKLKKALPGNQLKITPVGVIDVGFSPEYLPKKVSPELKACTQETCPQLLGTDKYGKFAILQKKHGTSVAHLIAHEGPVGIDSLLQISLLAVGSMEIVGSTDEMLKSVHSTPAVVNISLALGAGPVTKECLRKLGDAAIVVVAAGNDFPQPINENTATAGILVGSLAPDGLVSDFSQEDARVDISAPSDKLIPSFDHEGKITVFGGTSGAAPLVTGAVANVISLLPGITLPEMKLLVRNSAFSTTGTEFGNRRNGAGSLNFYKMIRVAEKLRNGWPGNRNELNSDKAFQFNSEALSYYAQALKLNPDASCEVRKSRLALLRKAAFLVPENQAFRNELAEMYENAGYSAQARFYRNPKDNLTHKEMRTKVESRVSGKNQ